MPRFDPARVITEGRDEGRARIALFAPSAGAVGTEMRTHLVYREAKTRTSVKEAPRSPCVVGLIRPSIIGSLSEAGPRDERFAPSQDLLLFA